MDTKVPLLGRKNIQKNEDMDQLDKEKKYQIDTSDQDAPVGRYEYPI